MARDTIGLRAKGQTSLFKKRRKAQDTQLKLFSASQELETPPQKQQSPRSTQPIHQSLLQPTPKLSPDSDINLLDLFRPHSAPLDTPSKATNVKPPRVVTLFEDITPKKTTATKDDRAESEPAVTNDIDESFNEEPLPKAKPTISLKSIAQQRAKATKRRTLRVTSSLTSTANDRAFIERLSHSSNNPSVEENMRLLDIATDTLRLISNSLRTRALSLAQTREELNDSYVLKLIGVVRSERDLPGLDPSSPFIPYEVQITCLEWLLDNLNVFPNNGIPALTRCIPILFQLMNFEYPRHLIAELIVVALVGGKSYQKWYYTFFRRQFEAHAEDFYIGAVFNIVRGLAEETPPGLPYPSPKITWRATTIQLDQVYEEIDDIHARGRKGALAGLNGTDLISRWFTADADAVVHRLMDPASYTDATPAYVALKLALSPSFVNVFDYIVSLHLANPATKPATLCMIEYVIRASGISPSKPIVKAITTNRHWSMFTILSETDVVSVNCDQQPQRYAAALMRWLVVNGDNATVATRLVEVCQHDGEAELTMMRLISGVSSPQIALHLTLPKLACYLVSTDPLVVSLVCHFLQQFKRDPNQRGHVETAVKWLWRNQSNSISFLSSKLLDQLDKLHVFDEVEGLTPTTMGHFYFHPGFLLLISSAFLASTQGPSTVPEALTAPQSCGCERSDQLCAHWLAGIDKEGFHGIAGFLFSLLKLLNREERAAYAKT